MGNCNRVLHAPALTFQTGAVGLVEEGERLVGPRDIAEFPVHQQKGSGSRFDGRLGCPDITEDPGVRVLAVARRQRFALEQLECAPAVGLALGT